MSRRKLINRDNYSIHKILNLIIENTLDRQESIRLLEESVHVIARQRNLLRDLKLRYKIPDELFNRIPLI